MNSSDEVVTRMQRVQYTDVESNAAVLMVTPELEEVVVKSQMHHDIHTGFIDVRNSWFNSLIKLHVEWFSRLFDLFR